MESINKPLFGTCCLALSGKNFNSSFNVSKTLCNDSWVLDFGATNHMTHHSSLLISYVSLFGNHITIANGTSVSIIGCGNVSPLSSFNLKYVLYIPSISNNLIFVKRLIHDLKCYVILSDSLCFPKSCHGEDNWNY